MAHLKQPARGIMFARSDANPAAMLAEVQKAFEDFKAAHAEQIKGVNAKFDDVVSRDKLDKVNAHLGEMQAALDATNAKLAAAQLGGGAAPAVKDPEYTAAFAQHFRRGDVSASLNKGTAPEGGYLAPTEWDRTITDKLIILSPVRQLATVQVVSTGSFSKLYNLRGTVSGWVGELTARPETATPTFGSQTFTCGEIYANAYASQQMLDDALVNLEAWLPGEINTEFAYQEGVAFISGSGANNRPNGLLTYVTGAANAAANPLGAIGLVNSGAAAAITADALLRLIYALPAAYAGNAQFGMNRNALTAARLLKDGQGNYLWQPSYVAGQPQTIAGYAVNDIPAMPDVAAGSKSVAFGDWAETYLIVDHAVGTRVLRDPYSAKPYVAFYVTKRVGGGVKNPEAMKVLNTSV